MFAAFAKGKFFGKPDETALNGDSVRVPKTGDSRGTRDLLSLTRHCDAEMQVIVCEVRRKTAAPHQK
jgi:hypothetical protein